MRLETGEKIKTECDKERQMERGIEKDNERKREREGERGEQYRPEK